MPAGTAGLPPFWSGLLPAKVEKAAVTAVLAIGVTPGSPHHPTRSAMKGSFVRRRCCQLCLLDGLFALLIEEMHDVRLAHLQKVEFGDLGLNGESSIDSGCNCASI